MDESFNDAIKTIREYISKAVFNFETLEQYDKEIKFQLLGHIADCMEGHEQLPAYVAKAQLDRKILCGCEPMEQLLVEYNKRW